MDADHVIQGDAETAVSELQGETFHAIVCGDILEHLREPLDFLRKARECLSPSGRLIASIPNVRHHSVVSGLIAGNWTYEAAGLLDQDHVRFFTRREIEKLVFRAGMSLESLEMIPGPGFEQWDQQGRPGTVSLGSLTLTGLSESDALEFHTYQYLISVSARPPVAAAIQDRGLIQLATKYQWPDRKPMVPIPLEETGWLADGPREALAEFLGPHTQVVVELGSWLGMSTRFIAEHAPAARVVAIDHWKGSPEHQAKPVWSRMLPMLYETFLAMNWEYRHQIIPVRETTQDGLRAVATAGIQPDVVFFDADHAQEAVAADVALAAELFPGTQFVGDDFDDPGVAAAITQFVEQHDCSLTTAGSTWRAWQLQSPGEKPVPADQNPERGLTSIVIITHNQLGVTQQCLRSIRQYTDLPYELILIDNASTDGTREYLRSLGNVTLIENEENRGFPAAANQGIRAAKGEQILLLNNDTVVTTGWLERLVDVLRSDPKIGLVGPCSNSVSGSQQVPVTYHDLSCLDGFAWGWARIHRGLVEETDRLVGFCLLIRRELIETVGLLDEQFGLGCFEDDDLCRRAQHAGYRAVIAREAFVHHFGSVTFRASGTDFGQLMAENQRKYESKWGGQSEQSHPVAQETTDPNSKSMPLIAETAQPQAYTPSPAPPAPQFDLSVSGEGAVLLTDQKVRLSLCMIVRDNEDTIRPCLESIRPWVDEIIIVDTGSVDQTPDICREFGARMFEFPWIDDFSAARNESIRHARGEWVFWMDSDDTIPEECGRGLRELADGDHAPGVFGYVVQVHCPGDDPSHDLTVVDHVKLFRNHKGLEFEGRIHEQIIPAIRRAGGEVAFTELFVVHSGSDRTEEGQKRKLERDFRILYRELEDQPDHPFVRFNLGMTHADAGEYEEAIEHLRHCIAVSQAEESHLRKAYALLVSSCAQSQRTEEALDVCQTGLKLYPDDKELLFRQALVLHELGRREESVNAYLRVLHDDEDRHFTSIDPSLTGFKARHNLAIVYNELQQSENAEEQWRLVLAEVQDYAPSVKGLADLLLRSERTGEVRNWALELQNRSSALGWYLAAKAEEVAGLADRAVTALAEGRQLFPESLDLLQEQCRVLFETKGPIAAEPFLRELAELTPGDASAWHNLGTVALQKNEPQSAIAALSRSVELRPESVGTWLQLVGVYSACGNRQEALKTLEAALQSCPGDRELLSAQDQMSTCEMTGEQHVCST